MHLVKALHTECVTKWMDLMNLSIEYACPLRCNPRALAVAEAALLSQASESQDSVPAQERATDEGEIDVDSDDQVVLDP